MASHRTPFKVSIKLRISVKFLFWFMSEQQTGHDTGCLYAPSSSRHCGLAARCFSCPQPFIGSAGTSVLLLLFRETLARERNGTSITVHRVYTTLLVGGVRRLDARARRNGAFENKTKTKKNNGNIFSCRLSPISTGISTKR